MQTKLLTTVSNFSRNSHTSKIPPTRQPFTYFMYLTFTGSQRSGQAIVIVPLSYIIAWNLSAPEHVMMAGLYARGSS